jgi:hypothetical protein
MLVAQQDPPQLLLKQLDVVLNALSILSGEAELWIIEGIDANAVWPLSLLALLLPPLLLGLSPCSARALPWWLLLLWLLTTRVSPGAATTPLSTSLWPCMAVLVWILLYCACCLCPASASAHGALVAGSAATDVVPGPLLLSGAERLSAAAVGLPLLESSPTVLVGGGCRKPAGMRLPLLCRLSSLLRGMVAPFPAALLVPSHPGAVAVSPLERLVKHPDTQYDAVLALLLLLLLLPGMLPEPSPLLLPLQAAAEAGRWLRAREVYLEPKNFHCWVLPATFRAPLLLSPAWFAGCS